MLDLNTEFGHFASKYIESEYFIWLTTVDATGTPQPKPVWFIWEAGSFLIFSQPQAYKLKHILKNPNVSLHFNTVDAKGGGPLIVFTGRAIVDLDCPPAHQVRAYLQKYENGIATLDSTPERFGATFSAALRIRPTKVRGWE